MVAGKKAQSPKPDEVIALPPLRMTLAHAGDDQVNKKALAAAIRKFLPQEEHAGLHEVMRLIEFLENNRRNK
ncbi:hypothetical protein [Candidatus Villigracilis saccharophilus]|uniref:hypothetical protein n=1 Tax=Candidatus Villigracilis saccharophilus TaxID=3140684 RepID=UPI00313547A3|nr:hypothetical protein [Anaerolineales bacterium]